MGEIHVFKAYGKEAPSVSDGDILLRITRRIADAFDDDSEFKSEAARAIESFVSEGVDAVEYETSRGGIVLRSSDDSIVVEFKSENQVKRLAESAFSRLLEMPPISTLFA